MVVSLVMEVPPNHLRLDNDWVLKAILWLRDPPTSGKLREFSGWLEPVFTDAPVVGHIAHESSQQFLQDGPQDSVQLPEKSGWILSFMNVYGRYNYR